MHNFMADWLTLVVIFALVVMSPGLDFIMVVKNSLTHGRRAGIFTAIGLGFGVMVHVSYTLLGIAALIAKSILFFNLLKYAGAAYLVYVGIKSVMSKGIDSDPLAHARHSAKSFGIAQALRSGFVTNVLNPKACLFFLSLFSQFIKTDTPHLVQIGYGATCVIMVMAWFAVMSVVLTAPVIRKKFLRATLWIDRICGIAFIGLGLKLALTKAPV